MLRSVMAIIHRGFSCDNSPATPKSASIQSNSHRYGQTTAQAPHHQANESSAKHQTLESQELHLECHGAHMCVYIYIIYGLY